METVNNLTQAASNAIFGNADSNKQEPISGVKGHTESGEPYDAGNMEPPRDNTQAEEESTMGTTSKPTTFTHSSTPNPTSTSADTSTNNPAEESPSSPSAIKDSTPGQADTRHPDNPTTKPGTSTDKNDVDNTSDEKPDVDGPGPRPLEEVARENGGAAGSSDVSLEAAPEGEDIGGSPVEAMGQTIKPLVSAGPDDNAGSSSGNKTGGEEGEDGPLGAHKSDERGTGEKWERSTGLASEGGDFDATRPGAGREADRILEEKGIKKSDSKDHDKKGKSETSLGGEDYSRSHDKKVGSETALGGEHVDKGHSDEHGESGSGEKKGLREKMKEKLHMH